MVWSDCISFHLMAADYFATFTPRPVADAHKSSQVLVALPLDSREAVDRLVEAAHSAGGKADPRPVMDLGWLYNRAFEDVDGHMFEVLSMDASAAPDGTA